MKRLVILADGTWNSPTIEPPTNILKLARGIAPRVAAGDEIVEQVVFYDWGVGTDRKVWSGGVSGAGIEKNILDGYRFLIHNYDPGDEIFLFGFSRGAWTVRSLAGLIRNCGILRRDAAKLSGRAFEVYRYRSERHHPDHEDAQEFRAENAVEDRTPITFLGVFDTVGALGVPISAFSLFGDENPLFHDVTASSIIQRARHAVSIDENREDYEATLWDGQHKDLKQVWFPGVHADIGGGYKTSGLSDIPFRWMLDEAAELGLKVEPHLFDKERFHPTSSGKIHNERTGKWRLRGELIRTIKGRVHRSAQKRWEKDVAGYGKRSKALRHALEEAGGWAGITIEPDPHDS